MSNAELNAARAEARKLLKNAQRKKLRLERSKGVNFEHPANRRFDPSVSPEKLERYTLKQVQAANARLKQFLNRNTQYYGDVKGRILPPKLVTEYRKAEKGYLQKASKEFMRIADVPAYQNDKSKQTVFDVWRQRTPDHGLSNAANTNPLTLKRKQLTGVTNAQSLEKLTKSMKEKNSPEWFKKQRQEHRRQADIMLRRGGMDREADRVRDLDDDRFDLLWGDHRFADAASLAYDIAQRTLRESKKEWYDRQIDNAINDIDDVITWAEVAKIRKMSMLHDQMTEQERYKMRSRNEKAGRDYKKLRDDIRRSRKR